MKKIYWLGFLPLVALAAITPNMLLNKPVSGDTNYVQKIDTIFNQIDSHDHTTGKGVQIPTGGLANGSVTSIKIANQAVGNAQLGLGSVTTQNLADDSVTYEKLADSSVGAGKIRSGVVGDVQMATRQVVDGEQSLSSANDYVQDSTYALTSTTATVAADTGLMLVMFGRGKAIELGITGNGSVTSYMGTSGAGLTQNILTITKSGTNLFSVSCGATTAGQCPLGMKFEDPNPGGSDSSLASVTYKVQMQAAPVGATASLLNARFTGVMKR